RFADQLDLGREVRIAVRLVDVHRPAEDDEAVVAGEPRPRVRVAAEVHVADAEPEAPEQRVQRAEDLVGDVLEDEQPAHGRRIIIAMPRARSDGGQESVRPGTAGAARAATRRARSSPSRSRPMKTRALLGGASAGSNGSISKRPATALTSRQPASPSAVRTRP